MADLVSAVGTVSYNGVTFGPKTRTEITGATKYDQAERTVTCVVYTVKIKTTIALDDQTTDTTLTDIRQRLQSAGGELTIYGKGFGLLQVNAGGAKDVLWGPKPRLLSWKSIGGNRACEIEWTCEVAIPECDAARYEFAVMEFNTRYSWAIDRAGYTRRTYSGYLKIPQTRQSQSDRSLSDNADAYRERIMPPPLEGFRRESETFDLDESKCRIDFNVVDEELPVNILPPGIVDATADQVVQTSPPDVGTQFHATLSASYEVAKNWPRSRAWECFAELVKQRIADPMLYAVGPFGERGSLIYTQLAVREPNIYGRNAASFSLSYTFTSTLQSFLYAGGLWRPVQGTSWALWATSLNQTSFAADGRGFAKLRFANSEDVIVDLCQTGNVRSLRGGRPAPPQERRLSSIIPPYPRPESSWLDFRLSAKLEYKDYNTVLKAMPLNQIEGRQIQGTSLYTPSQETPSGGRVVNIQRGMKSPYKPGEKTGDVQVRAQPDVYLRLSGEAIRAGYLVDEPVVNNVGNGITATPDNDGDGFAQCVVANYCGVPVVAAKWDRRYYLSKIPDDGLGVPPIPPGLQDRVRSDRA